MPDIFGRNPEDYPFVRALHENNQWERYQRANADRRPNGEPQHKFNALGAGAPQGMERAAEDAQALGFLTNNLLSIQTMIDNLMYTAYSPAGVCAYQYVHFRGRVRIRCTGYEPCGQGCPC